MTRYNHMIMNRECICGHKANQHIALIGGCNVCPCQYFSWKDCTRNKDLQGHIQAVVELVEKAEAPIARAALYELLAERDCPSKWYLGIVWEAEQRGKIKRLADTVYFVKGDSNGG